jgi:2-amino-4-hydroxy-6-hydroxymethyldihydropteridine diphosphokinase
MWDRRCASVKRRSRSGYGSAVHCAYVGIGANLGDRERTIADALRRVAALPTTELVAVSTLRETEPWGPVEQPRYLNGAAALRTELEPAALLGGLLAIERSLGRDREREIRWGPRTIDLDLLLVDDLVLTTPMLEPPHPRLHERAFVLEPLAELDPALVVPGRGTVSDLLAALHSDA